MGRVTRTKDLNPELWKIFDEYVHGFIDRRGFIDRASTYVVAPMTAAIALGLGQMAYAFDCNGDGIDPVVLSQARPLAKQIPEEVGLIRRAHHRLDQARIVAGDAIHLGRDAMQGQGTVRRRRREGGEIRRTERSLGQPSRRARRGLIRRKGHRSLRGDGDGTVCGREPVHDLTGPFGGARG